MERLIMHIDMDAFFASVEAKRDPALRGKPIAVIGSSERTVVTTASYEARRFGVKTGMNKYEARRLCRELILVVGDNTRYTDASGRIMEILSSYTPLVEPYSIDEAFLDVTGVSTIGAPQGLDPKELARAIQVRIYSELGLTCSIGIAPGKLMAKLASKMKKPAGIVRIKEAEVTHTLRDLPVSELWGIGKKTTRSLSALGIRRCGELGRYPVSILRRRFGITGERLSLMGRGIDLSPVAPYASDSPDEEERVKSVGHSTTLPFDVTDKSLIKSYLLRLTEKAARRARKHSLMGTCITLTVRYNDFHTFGRSKRLKAPTNETRAIYSHICSILDSISLVGPVRLLGVSISGLLKDPDQGTLFEEERTSKRLTSVMDAVKDLFGDDSLGYASEEASAITGADNKKNFGNRKEVGTISPAWRPKGLRRVEFS